MTAGGLVTFIDRQRKYCPLIAEACRKVGILPSWGIAIARKESLFVPDVPVLTGADGDRGGAYGLMQMTYQTAQGLGYVGAPAGLGDVHENILYGTLLLAQLHKRYPLLRDVASAYNSGKPYKRAPSITQREYVPAVEKYQAWYAPLYDGRPVNVT